MHNVDFIISTLHVTLIKRMKENMMAGYAECKEKII
jgi:hypothetical protein